MNDEQLKDRFFGTVLRYRYLEVLGRGGMSVVFKAMDLELEEVLAVKVLSPQVSVEDPDLLARFKREINLNRKIKHPNVARLYDFGSEGGLYYITMEFIPGTDLKTLIEAEGTMGLAPRRAISVLRQIALGTHAAHRLGIIHRDLKSSNIIVDERGGVAILDFGLARSKFNRDITLASVMVGTPNYMSPEQALGNPVDARCDIYSIGVIAFEALTGELPFTGDSPVKVAFKHVSDPVPDTMEYFPGISPALKAIVYKALSKNPEDRFATAAEMEAELAAVQHELSSGSMRIAHEVRKRTGVSLPPPAPVPVLATPIPVPPPVPAPRAVERPAAVPVRPPRILVVDPDPKRRAHALEMIHTLGCEPVEAPGGAEALNILFSGRFDLVFMELRLQGMDGFDVTRVIRTRPDLNLLPVLLAVPRLDRGQYAFGIQSGVTDMVPSPYTAEHLERAVWRSLVPAGFVPSPEVETRLARNDRFDVTDPGMSRPIRDRRS